MKRINKILKVVKGINVSLLILMEVIFVSKGCGFLSTPFFIAGIYYFLTEN